MTDSTAMEDDTAPIDAEFEPSEADPGRRKFTDGPGWRAFGVLLIVLFALIAYIIWSRGFPSHRAALPDQTAAASDSGLISRIQSMENRLDESAASVSAAQQATASLTDEISSLRSAVDTTQTQLARLDRRVADVDGADGGVTVPESLMARIASLEDAVTESSSGANSDAVAALASEVARLRQDMQSGLPSSNDVTLQQASLAMIAISAEAARGRPFMLGYQQLYSALPDNTLVSGLQTYAQEGVPTQSALSAEFAVLRAGTLAAAEASDGIEPGWVDQLFGDNVRVTRTSVTPLIGTLDRAATLIEEGDLEAAIAELDTLPADQATRFNVWIGNAQDRIDLDQRLDSLRLLLVSLAQQ